MKKTNIITRQQIFELINSDISLVIDFIFKLLFSKNPDLLIDFLEPILKKKINYIEVMHDFALDKFFKGEKQGVLDLKATLSTGEIINIEMQVRNKHNTFERMQYYASKLYTHEIKAGGEYKKAKQIICISILDYVLHENQDNYIAQSRLNFVKIDENGNEIIESKSNDLITFITIELPIFRKMKHNMKNKLEQWLALITKSDITEIEEAMKYNEKIKKALEELSKVEATPEVLSQIEKLEDDMRNYRDETNYLKEQATKEGLKQGIEQGIEKGLEQGIVKNQIETIKKLYTKGLTILEISEMLEIPEDKINKILK